LYAYSQGVSSAREIARRCEFEPAFQWLCGLQPISHRTLSGFRSDNKDALGSVFVQVVGVLSAEGLITMERVTLDGTKIKANASGNTFRRKEKIEAHLAAAQTQLEKMNEQAAEEEKVAKRQAVAKQRAARERVTRLESALREVERLQKKKKEDKKAFVARASTTDAEAHVMRNGEGGTVPSYNVQLVTDTTHGFVVNVEATTDAIDYRQLEPALDRCKATLGCLPKQFLPMGTIPTMRLCRLLQSLASTSTARGKIAGNRQIRMLRDAAGPLSAVLFLMMRRMTFTSALPDSN
jgi:hypothetical protein